MYGLDFGEPQRVETRKGTAFVREAAPTEQFWKAWRQNKDEVKAVGFSLRSRMSGSSRGRPSRWAWL